MEWSIAIIAVMLSAYGFYTGGTEGSKGFVRRNRLTMYVDAKALHVSKHFVRNDHIKQSQVLTLSQTANFRLFQTERVFR